MKIELAVFKNDGDDRVINVSQYKDWLFNDDDYIQMTEIIEVEFTALKDVDVVEKQIAVIDKQIKAFKAASQVKLNQMEQAKQELLALPAGDSL